MNKQELLHIGIAIVILTAVISLKDFLAEDFSLLGMALIASVLIIGINIGVKKLTAYVYDCDVQHRIWMWSRYGLKQSSHLKRDIPAGIIVPLLGAIISLGALKITSILTYDSTAQAKRLPKKEGFYSFTEVTEWENGIIGSAGIIAVLTLSFVTYWIPGLELISQTAAFYAFFNMFPVSKLDGTQIFFGSRVVWTALALISTIFAVYAVILL